MVENLKDSSIAYRCPHCGNGVISMVGALSLTGNMIRLKCPCGKSELTCSIKDDRVSLNVPCVICPKPHNFSAKKNLFFSNDLFGFGCTYTGFDICFAGKYENVSKALDEQAQMLEGLLLDTGEESLDKLRTEDPYAEFDDPQIDEIIRFTITDLSEEGKLYCSCKEGETAKYTYEFIPPDFENIKIKCLCCNYEKIIPMGSNSHAQAFLDYDELRLEPPKEK